MSSRFSRTGLAFDSYIVEQSHVLGWIEISDEINWGSDEAVGRGPGQSARKGEGQTAGSGFQIDRIGTMLQPLGRMDYGGSRHDVMYTQQRDPGGSTTITGGNAYYIDCRYILKGDLGLKAASKILPTTIEKLEGLYDKMENTELTIKENFLLNQAFYMTIYKTSNWEHSCRIVFQLLDQILVFYAYHLPRSGNNIDFRPYNKEHADIIKSLKSKNSQKVKDKIVANIRRGYNLIRRVSADFEKTV